MLPQAYIPCQIKNVRVQDAPDVYKSLWPGALTFALSEKPQPALILNETKIAGPSLKEGEYKKTPPSCPCDPNPFNAKIQPFWIITPIHQRYADPLSNLATSK